jgi:excisionase family DNA binding protein
MIATNLHRRAVCDPRILDTFSTEGHRSPDVMRYEPLLNDAEAARFLGGIHPKTVQRMARRGEVPSYRVGKYWRYRASELSAWLVLHSSGQIHPPAHRKEIQ